MLYKSPDTLSKIRRFTSQVKVLIFVREKNIAEIVNELLVFKLLQFADSDFVFFVVCLQQFQLCLVRNCKIQDLKKQIIHIFILSLICFTKNSNKCLRDKFTPYARLEKNILINQSQKNVIFLYLPSELFSIQCLILAASANNIRLNPYG